MLEFYKTLEESIKEMPRKLDITLSVEKAEDVEEYDLNITGRKNGIIEYDETLATYETEKKASTALVKAKNKLSSLQ